MQPEKSAHDASNEEAGQALIAYIYLKPVERTLLIGTVTSTHNSRQNKRTLGRPKVNELINE